MYSTPSSLLIISQAHVTTKLASHGTNYGSDRGRLNDRIPRKRTGHLLVVPFVTIKIAALLAEYLSMGGAGVGGECQASAVE